MATKTPVACPLPGDVDGFLPGKSTPEAHKRALYPPCPDPKSAPQEYALWNSIAVRNPTRVAINIVEYSPPKGLYESKNWSGAVLPTRPQVYPPNPPETTYTGPTDPFDRVVGSWVIPNPHPVIVDGKYKDGDYEMYTWVGLDGWENTDCLKIGVVSVLQVKNSKIIKRENYAAILFRGKYDKSIRYFVFDGFIVEPGDLITGCVWGEIGSSTGYGWICNEGRNEWASGRITAASGVTLQGTSSEWIMAGQGPLERHPHPFPNYGATVFFNGFADYVSGKWAGINRAMLANAVDVNSSADRGQNILVYGGTALINPH